MLLFLGSTEISLAVLKVLSQDVDCVVFTKPGTQVEEFAKKYYYGRCFVTSSLRTFELNLLTGCNFDFLLAVDFGLLVPKTFLMIPQIAPVNIHASLLPKFRGAAPLQRAILEGESETGISYMRMTEGLDTGCVYTQFKIPITEETTYSDLRKEVANLAAQTVTAVLRKIKQNQLECVPQQEALATYASKITVEMEKLVIQDVTKTLRHINALSCHPGAYITFRNKRLKILKARKASGLEGGSPELFNVGNKLYLRCNDGCLEILICQPEGGKVLAAESFLNGMRGKVEETLSI